jgi:hypothetical protein
MGGQAETSGSRARRRALAGAAALALLTTGLTTGLTGTARAAYPGADGRIAFVQADNIYTITPSGQGLKKLTGGNADSAPVWSPSGQEIAYLYRGNLWTMAAGGGQKTQITRSAPEYTDSRAAWSPNGQYLAFVKTQRGQTSGYLTRYNTVTHGFVTFSIPYHSEGPTRRQVKVTALPRPVAWAWAANGDDFGSFILFQGAGATFCSAHRACLNAYGRPSQSLYRNGFLSLEDSAASDVHIGEPDWFPDDPQFDTQVLTTWQHCTSHGCVYSGIKLEIGESLILPGAYEAVYSPVGRQIAYVQNVGGKPQVYVGFNSEQPDGVLLTPGSQPDWQPLRPT